LHVARIAAYLWRSGDSFSEPTDTLRTQIATLQSTPAVLNPHLDAALSRLESLINANPDFANDVDGALKSALLETAITRSLHASPAPSNPVPQAIQLTL